MKRYLAEAIGTFILVFGGCGSAVFSAGLDGNQAGMGIGYLGVAIAFGLTVFGCAYAFGGISGCHLNPAVTLGLTAAGRVEAKHAPWYIASQVLGAIAASAVLLFILNQAPGGYDLASGLASNGYGEHSPGGFSMMGGFVSEVILTFIFLVVILGVTSKHAKANATAAGAAIGLTLTLIHLVGIPITNLSVNPARSTGPALFVGGWAVAQLWLFWVAPVIGGVLAGLLSRFLNDSIEPAI